MKLLTAIFALIIVAFIGCQTKTKQSSSKQGDIIFKDSAGHLLSRSDLANTTGKVDYEIIGGKQIDAKAEMLHREARVLGQEGKYDSSIEKLNEAIKIQPTWAYPVYDLAFTYLLKGDFENALKFYKKTDELEPKGFFTSKTAIYSLEGEKAGKFPKGMYTTYLQIEWADERSKKVEIAKAITKKIPDFAPAWKELASLLEDKKERLDAIEQGLSKDPDAETKGILIINKALLFDNDGKKEEAKNLLGNLIFSQDVTTGNIELAKFTLRTISEH